jgi:hypothetical protein
MDNSRKIPTRLVALSLVFLGATLTARNADSSLCVRGNGTLTSRRACRKGEKQFPIDKVVEAVLQTLLPAALPPRRAALETTAGGPISLVDTGAKIDTLTLPTVDAGDYVVFATLTVQNHGVIADSVYCSLVVQTPGSTDPLGLRLADSSVLVDAGTSAALSLIGALPILDPGSLQNGSGAVALWCFGSTGASFTSGFAALVAIPVDQLQTQ